MVKAAAIVTENGDLYFAARDQNNAVRASVLGRPQSRVTRFPEISVSRSCSTQRLPA
jgi:hypothetical protein